MQHLLLIRVDASINAGTGHVMRMLALAQAWRKAKGDVLFLCAEITSALEAKLEVEGFPLQKIGVTPGSRNDLEATVSAIDRHKDTGSLYAVALDGYYFKADFQLGLRNTGSRLLVVDDFGHSDFYHADFILNQNISARAEIYGQRNSNARLLLGPKYALLRRAFLESRLTPRDIPNKATKLLVTMGGSDPDNVTQKVLDALLGSALDVKVAVGGSNPHLPALRQAAQDVSRGAPHVELVVGASNMMELMAWADMAIAAGGSTAWELACTGLPTLFVILAENQKESTCELERQGFGICLGEPSQLDKHLLQKELEALAGNHRRRASFAERGRQMVDGLGANRVVALLAEKDDLLLEKVSRDDFEILWEWTNDPGTRGNSFESAPIPWEEHERWCRLKLRDPNCTLWIVSTEGFGKVGVVRFDRKNSEATISVSLAPRARGKGYGSKVIRFACERILESPGVNAIHAWIKPANKASIRAFERAHFQECADAILKDQPAKHYILQRPLS
jgi:UDP-2,4-diacetamido-2,4,6-trideoxy-beta-L-altropyranose hydrolase